LAVTSASAKESFATESFSPTNTGCSVPYCNDEDDVQLRQHSSSDHYQRDAKRTQRRAVCLRLSGMFGMTVLNPLCCVLAMNYASPSILAPFSGLTLVWIIVFSESLIGERPMTIQIVAAGLIICGETIVAIFGDHTNDGEKSIDDVRASYIDTSFLVYLGCMVLWMCVLGYVIMRKSSRFSTETFRRFAWGVAGGSITGLQNFLKDSLTIIKAVGTGGASEGMPYPWFFPLLAALAAATSFTGLLFLTVCMKKFDATFSSAMFVGSFVVSASFMSAVHYSTFQGLEGLINYIMYPFGLLVLMTGVGILLRNTSSGGGDVADADEACEYSGEILAYHSASEDADERGSGRNCMREPLVSPRTQVGELT
jgi:drug/metabolite transporter (DMT)-like permease